MNRMTKYLNNIVTFFVIGVILLIIVPLPSFVLDVLLLANISLSLCILLITMYVKEPLEFSVFPSVLLVTTLFRIGLNVSSTRLILGHGGQAGKVIKTFGEFVIGGNAVVGFIVFLIIVIVQFLVITKGAERVAEVSARFTLDAMPGKQMAIDADLNSGMIDEKTARQRRTKVQREADFYGAMDGASKFVKGDAIVSILVVVINILGGTVIGMVEGGQSFAQVLSIYTIATVGDGLVSQLPALMVSTATGMVVTRAASENDLGQDISRQMLTYPVVFTIAGALLLLLCLVPGFPAGTLIILGATLLFVGVTRTSKKKAADAPPEEARPVSEMEFYKSPENIYSLLTVETLEMEFGYSLLPLVDERKGGTFVDRVVMLRRKFATDMGFVIPAVQLRDNMNLGTNQYVIKLRGEEIARGEVLVDHYLTMNAGGECDEVEGIDTVEPAFGIKARWVDEENRERAEMLGFTVIDALSVIITHLSEVVKKHAQELLGRKEVGMLLDNLKKTNKQLVEDTVPGIIGVGSLQKILCTLLEEQIPIRDLDTILETVADTGLSVKDPDLLTEYVRQALRRTITRKFAEKGSIKAVTVGPEVENMIIGSVKHGDHGSYLAMEPESMQKIVKEHVRVVDRIRGLVRTPIVLTSPVVRLYYERIIRQFSADAVVLSYNEIEPDVQVQSVASVTI
ncbi:MAG TPA: flagellar biosynthesis protein FlhA [Terriglobales bacterium]|nr:flagellar biosynthesis protein FlhA [Terriglobales bacterium]